MKISHKLLLLSAATMGLFAAVLALSPARAQAALEATIDTGSNNGKLTVEFKHPYAWTSNSVSIFKSLDEFIVKCDSSDVKINVLGNSKTYPCGTDFRKFVKKNDDDKFLRIVLQFSNPSQETVRVGVLEHYYVCNYKKGDSKYDCSGSKSLVSQVASVLVPPTSMANPPQVFLTVNGVKEAMVLGSMQASNGYPSNNKDLKTLEWSSIGADKVRFDYSANNKCRIDSSSSHLFQYALDRLRSATPLGGRLTEATSNYEGCVVTIGLTGTNSASGLSSSDTVKIYFGIGDKDDSSAPTIPQNITATAVSLKQVNLAWEHSEDDLGVLGYNIYRDGVLLQKVRPYVEIGGPSQSLRAEYSDMSALPRTTHSYSIQAYDFAGNVSARSVAVTARTFMEDNEPPQRPVISDICYGCAVKGHVTFMVKTRDDVGIEKFRVLGDGGQYQIGPEALIVESLQDPFPGSDVASDKNYLLSDSSPFSGNHSYQVIAIDRAGNESAPSNVLYILIDPNKSVVTTTQPAAESTTIVTTKVDPVEPPADAVPPTVPSGLSAKAVSAGEIVLSWAASSDNKGVLGYRIYRNGVYLTQVSDNMYRDLGLSPDTAYWYSVAAIDNTGNVSAQSNSYSAMTIEAPTSARGKLNVTNSSAVPSRIVKADGSLQDIGSFTTTVTGEPIAVQDIVFLAIISPVSASPIRDIVIVDENGTVVAGPVTARTTSLSGTPLSAQPFTVDGPFRIPVGVHTYTIRAKLPTGLPDSTTIMLTTTPFMGWTGAQGLSSGTMIDMSSVGRFNMNIMTVSDPSAPTKKLVVPVASTPQVNPAQPQTTPAYSTSPTYTYSPSPNPTYSATPTYSSTPTYSATPTYVAPTPTATYTSSPVSSPATTPVSSPLPTQTPVSSATPIYTPVGTITLASPNGGETFHSGDTIRVSWSSANVSSPVSIDLVDSSGAYIMSIASNQASTGIYDWYIPRNLVLAFSAAFKIKASTVANGTTLSDQSNSLFYVYPPVSTSPSPTTSSSPSPTSVSYRADEPLTLTAAIWTTAKIIYSFLGR